MDPLVLILRKFFRRKKWRLTAVGVFSALKFWREGRRRGRQAEAGMQVVDRQFLG